MRHAIARPFVVALACCIAALAAPPAATAATPPKAAPTAQRWDLRDVYPTADAWQAAYAEAVRRVDALASLREAFSRGAAPMLAALTTISDVRREVARLHLYAALNADEDLRDARLQERKASMQALWSKAEAQTAWLAPSIQALGAERARGWLATDAALKSRFDLQIDDALRRAPHTLSPEGEALLAAAGIVLEQPANVYEQLAEAELPRPQVRLHGGRVVTLTQPVYEVERRSPRRADRKRVFDAFFGGYKAFEGTFGANQAAKVHGAVYAARARKFDTALAAALFDSNMPVAVHEQLVAQARAGLPTLHRYLALRKRMLGIAGSLAYHDNYPPLVAPPRGKTLDVARAEALTLEALAPLGDEYLGLLRQGFAGRWSDTHPRPGKPGGAYVAGYAYDVHPYVLLNHTDDHQSLSTFAHEWGHAVHTLLTTKNQPFEKSDYSTFIAESASIGNEMLLSDHLVRHAGTRAEKMYHLAQALESIRTTFFRQTMFAEFELAMHREVEQGRPLSGTRLSELYCGIAKAYYGEAAGVMTVDPAYCVEWIYISHFYRGFYVWQYATSMVGAAEFTSAIARDGAAARDRFIDLLKAGGSDYAYPLYVKAGIDLARPEPYQALMARMNRLIDEFERLATLPRP